MCGIVGYVGQGENIPRMVDKQLVKDGTSIDVLCGGLARLEYRGYDSAGIALKDDANIYVIKGKGRVKDIEELLLQSGLTARHFEMGIAHTRWATHGEPSDCNAHPLCNADGSIAVVHNGIIENYRVLKNDLIENGYRFCSETDTEVIAHQIDLFYNQSGNFEEAVRLTLSMLKGSYAFLAMQKDSGQLIGARSGSPLCLGIDDGQYIFGSDESPFIDITQKVIYLEDREMAVVDRSGARIMTFKGAPLDKAVSAVPFNIQDIGKNGFAHFMNKEISEQPITISNTYASRINHLENMRDANFPDLPDPISRIIFLACGTSWHASLIGQYIMEPRLHIPVYAEAASEFRYRTPHLTPNDVVIAVSQSGETADTKEALKLAKDLGCYVAGMVNVVGSEIARIAGKGLYLHAGPEIGVASTKAFTSQVMAINLLNLMLAKDKDYCIRQVDEIKDLPRKLRKTIETVSPMLEEIAAEFSGMRNFLYLGRGINYPVALEGALKLKEISYIHAEGYSAGEMKHGPIALIDDGMPSVFIMTGDGIDFAKTISNLQEIKARRGKVIVFTDNPMALDKIAGAGDHIIPLMPTSKELSPIINIVPLQLFAYYMAREKGCDIDKPRNLAKSVTVE